jgi:hypothetical protein
MRCWCGTSGLIYRRSQPAQIARCGISRQTPTLRRDRDRRIRVLVMNSIDRGRVGHERRLADVPPRPNAAMRCSVFGSKRRREACGNDRSIRTPSPSHRRASAERRIRAAARPRGEAIASPAECQFGAKAPEPERVNAQARSTAGAAMAAAPHHQPSRRPAAGRQSDPLHPRVGRGRRDRAVRGVWQGRSVASQARSPLLVSGTGVGLTVHG